jgi:hypothetical protein
VVDSSAALEQLWGRVRADGSAPRIDFATEVVVAMTIPDDACPPKLTEMVVHDRVVVPTFVEPRVACDQPLIARCFVVAVERASIPTGTVVNLPGDPTVGQPAASIPL